MRMNSTLGPYFFKERKARRERFFEKDTQDKEIWNSSEKKTSVNQRNLLIAANRVRFISGEKQM